MHTQISKSWHQQLYALIQEHPNITLFRHINPDGDAYGSVCGLYHWIKQEFPTKQVYLCAEDEGNLVHYFRESNVVSDEIIQNSLAIIIDTSNSPRISDQRALQAKVKVKIDHHPFSDCYADYEFIEDTMSSSCEIIAGFIYCVQKKAVSLEIARVLYAGMLTDTVSFTISSVKSNTLMMAGWLLESGLDVASVHESLFAQDKTVYDYVTFLRNHCVSLDNGLIYSYVSQSDLKQFNMSFNQAKEFVNTYKIRRDAKVWILFIENEEGLYNGSLRSKKVTVNDIAQQFGGGGHRLAAGTKELTLEQTQSLIDCVNQRLNQTH